MSLFRGIISRVSTRILIEPFDNILCFASIVLKLPNLVVLVNVSPAELSRHAIELEKRAIQLTVEEGKKLLLFLHLWPFFLDRLLLRKGCS